PDWQEPIQASLLNNQTLYTAPLPGSGIILTFILNILSNFIDVTESMSVTTHQRIVESFKFGYGKRTLLGDARFLDIDDVVAELTSKEHAEQIRESICDFQTFQDPAYYGANTTNVEDHGTAHISILAPNGDAVSVTSTINFLFGAGFASDSTGIILNDEMDDFASPNITSGFNIPPSP
ncbi:glutathione hydrolase 1 proenzyme-like, partial [Anoplophora glabripennis]|uniref:glutathione hydrolase 1 proenzyme-like n=1 Tax=Anoplophora glabripennis TaxID=217634 RepID=UPI0008746780